MALVQKSGCFTQCTRPGALLSCDMVCCGQGISLTCWHKVCLHTGECTNVLHMVLRISPSCPDERAEGGSPSYIRMHGIPVSSQSGPLAVQCNHRQGNSAALHSCTLKSSPILDLNNALSALPQHPTRICPATLRATSP